MSHPNRRAVIRTATTIDRLGDPKPIGAIPDAVEAPAPLALDERPTGTCRCGCPAVVHQPTGNPIADALFRGRAPTRCRRCTCALYRPAVVVDV